VPEPADDAELRVALLNPCYWPEVRRGSERFARELADGLLSRGRHPSLITSHPGRPRRWWRTVVCPAAVEEPRKHVRLLLEAFALVRERIPEGRLVLSRPRDRAAAARAGVSADAKAAGVEWRDVDDARSPARAYGEAWVAVLPAVDEAFGLVLLESLACGTPVVGYDDLLAAFEQPALGSRSTAVAAASAAPSAEELAALERQMRLLGYS
jgi:glycosyltransferase involved in cell wall biosynthesis